MSDKFSTMKPDSQALYPTRFVVHTGDQTTMPCALAERLDELMDKLWRKKGFPLGIKEDYEFRLPTAEIYPDPHQTFGAFVQNHYLFREDEQDMLQLNIVPKADRGDKMKRETKQATPSGYTFLKGPLERVSTGRTNALKPCYVVLQDVTMLVFQEEKQYVNKTGPAQFAVPMGSCKAAACAEPTSRLTASGSLLRAVSDQPQKDKKYYFVVECEHVGIPKQVLVAPSEQVREQWLKGIRRLNMNRAKTVVFMCTEELFASQCLGEAGLFRVSGSSDVIANFKKQHELGLYPPLKGGAGEHFDPHVVTGILKATLREMDEPLVTYDHYTEFLKIGGTLSKDKLTEEERHLLKDAVEKLPLSNRMMLQYIMNLFGEVAEFQEENKMGAGNLAIVVAPNILKPLEESALTAMGDNQRVLRVTEAMIAEHKLLWTHQRDLKTQLRTTKTKTAEELAASLASPAKATMAPSSSSGKLMPPPGRGKPLHELVQKHLEQRRIFEEKLATYLRRLDDAWEKAAEKANDELTRAELEDAIHTESTWGQELDQSPLAPITRMLTELQHVIDRPEKVVTPKVANAIPEAVVEEFQEF